MTSALRLLLIVFAGSAYAGEPPKETGTPKTPEQILAMAASITGLQPLPDITFSPLAESDRLPFLKQLVGQNSVTVKFRSGPLVLPSDPNRKDKYSRNFVAHFLADTGQLVSIKSSLPEKDSDPLPEFSPATAEDDLKGMGESYTGLQTATPKISFFDAVNAIKIGSPYEAQEISGVYVMDSQMGRPPSALWIISLRGIPPLEPQSGSDPSLYSKHHLIRAFIDATTGACLSVASTYGE